MTQCPNAMKCHINRRNNLSLSLLPLLLRRHYFHYRYMYHRRCRCCCYCYYYYYRWYSNSNICSCLTFQLDSQRWHLFYYCIVFWRSASSEWQVFWAAVRLCSVLCIVASLCIENTLAYCRHRVSLRPWTAWCNRLDL